MDINPIMANPGETVTLTVHVKCSDIGVQNALVTLVSDFGNLSQYTNSSGLCVFSFAAPQITSQKTFALVITASKDGYLDASGTFYLDVVVPTAPQTGFPLTTFMIIAAIILIIVVIIALLFKFKVIEVSWEEEAKT